MSRRSIRIMIVGSLSWVGAIPAGADIAENQVLVVYNSASAEASTLLGDYLAAHPYLPASNVLDLNNAALLTSDQTYAQFVSNIRNPIRDYLSAPAYPQPGDIIAIVLLRPFPHRLRDTDNALVGDNPSAAATEFTNGDATCACIDAELVLLWQNLETGEAGGTMDSKSDNMIVNPYHQSTTPIDAFSRSSITSAKTFANLSNVAWGLTGSGASRLRAGDLYLVCRIDGTTLADARALIARAQAIPVDQATVRVLLDEYDLTVRDDLDDDPLFTTSDPFLAGDDYEETRDALLATGWDVRYDDTFDFVSGTEETTPLVAYASYGENHDVGGAGENPPGTGTYIAAFNFAAGAMFNTIESYNGRALNGLGTLFGQEQAADFIAAGGTFAVGQVFEPFTFTVPDNEFLFPNMLDERMCWAEAAYTSLPALSWQQIVLGDPLGRFGLRGDIDEDNDVDLGDFGAFAECLFGPDVTPAPSPPPTAQQCLDVFDLDKDGDVDLRDFVRFQMGFTG